MLSAPNTTALAATGTKISSVPLSIESEIVVGDIDDVVITNEPSDEWDDGDKPKLKITLYADDDYYFASGFSKSSVSLSGSDGTVTSVSRSASDTLIVYSSYITKSGYYTFKVRGVYSTSDKGSWEESDSWYVSSSEAQEIISSGSSKGNTPSNTTSSGTGAWLKDDAGWCYCNADRSYTINGWQYIDNLWYCFDENGYMRTGWILYKDAWYYCGESGAMLVNTTTPDGNSGKSLCEM
jgi:glucan-binding YG repeat protein